MRILLFAKRRPVGRDLLSSPYGRFFYLSAALSGRGHQVTLLLASYLREPDEDCVREGVCMRSVSVRGGRIDRYLRAAISLTDGARPDWIGGLSDTWYALVAQHAARRCGARLWVDAYDNYASYIPWAWPLHAAWRHAAARADLLPFVCDAAAAKQGKFMPGSHIPILPPAALNERQPDRVIILPWNIAAEVRQQNAFVTERGGKFVVAVPTLQVLA